MNNEHEWVEDFYRQALAENRPDKLVLLDLTEQMESLSKENPDQRLALCERGHTLATQFNEPWWSAFFGFWKCEILLYQKHDPEAALRVAAALVVETRGAGFRAFPYRVAIHLNFIAAYFKIDPIGYAPQIRAALENSEMEWDQYPSFYLLYWQLRTRFLTALDNPEAVEIGWQHFGHACHYHATQDNGSSHYVIYALVDLLNALHRFDRTQARRQVVELAEMGADLSRRDANERLNAIFTMWRAVGARFSRNESEAKRFYRLAQQKQAALSPPRNATFPIALVFHEAGGEGELALAICDEAIEVARSRAHWFEAASYGSRKCEILRGLNRPWQSEAAPLREVAAHLPSQEYWEEKLRDWQRMDESGE
ncbi:MAG: hypothetical protein KY445_00675 [Armatimonadetes bacterium]|nr:hypothetical protein [Armatimonadota bacterium]